MGVPKQSKMCIKMYNILMEREGGRPNLIVLNHFLPRLRVRNLPKMHQKLKNMGLFKRFFLKTFWGGSNLFMKKLELKLLFMSSLTNIFYNSNI